MARGDRRLWPGCCAAAGADAQGGTKIKWLFAEAKRRPDRDGVVKHEAEAVPIIRRRVALSVIG
jgi:hypothetical protein